MRKQREWKISARLDAAPKKQSAHLAGFFLYQR
jgi:hypothetical protein